MCVFVYACMCVCVFVCMCVHAEPGEFKLHDSSMTAVIRLKRSSDRYSKQFISVEVGSGGPESGPLRQLYFLYINPGQADVAGIAANSRRAAHLPEEH